MVSRRRYDHNDYTIAFFPDSHKSGRFNEKPSAPIAYDSPYITVELGRATVKILLDDIYYFEKIKGTHNICVVYNGGYSIFRGELKEIKGRLNENFAYSHMAVIVNGARIRGIGKGTDHSVYFDHGQSCIYSRSRRKELVQWIKS